MSQSKTSLPGLVVLILVVFGLYIGYHLLILLCKIFVYLGYNITFFFDALLKNTILGPVGAWSVLGLFLGALIGVIVALKKFQLSKKLLLYPIGAIILMILIMAFVNKPLSYDQLNDYKYNQQNTLYDPAPTPPEKPFAKAKIQLKVRYTPSASSKIAFQVPKGMTVQIDLPATQGTVTPEWVYIYYAGKSGYIKMKFLELVEKN